VGTGDPKHPLPFPFRELTDDEFDELVYLVAHTTDGDVVKTRAADGGLDTVRLNLRDPGRTIAKRFFHHDDPADLVDRATRARGPLRTAEDLLEREGTTGEFLRTADPHFDFHTINRPWSEAEPPRTPNAAMRLQFRRGQQQLIVDAVPRNAAALLEYGPKGSAQFDDHDRALGSLGS
jgi:hypothetical protein